MKPIRDHLQNLVDSGKATVKDGKRKVYTINSDNGSGSVDVVLDHDDYNNNSVYLYNNY